MLDRPSEPSISAVNLRAYILALKASKVLHRHRSDVSTAMERASELLCESELFLGGGFEIQVFGQQAQHWAFGEPQQQDCVHFFGAHNRSRLSVRVWLISGEEVAAQVLHLLAEYLAQQIALAVEIHELAKVNAALSVEIRIDGEGLALRKLLERAKTLLASQGAMTREQAHDFLLASSRRSGKPISQVVQEITLVFGAPERRSGSKQGPRYRAPQYMGLRHFGRQNANESRFSARRSYG